MRSLSAILVLGFQAALWSQSSSKALGTEKELIMLEIEPTPRDERIKRSSDSGGLRFVRQAQAIPPEYLNLLQQLSPQQAAQQQQIQQLLVARDGSKQPAAARYVLSQDGRIVQESLGLQALQQQNLQQQQQQFLQIPQPGQPQQPEPGRPLLSPELEAFSRAQTQLQQDYHDAPIRAQIAGLTERPDPVADTLRNPPPPGGPGSPSPQIFSQAANQALARHEARIRTQLLQDPTGQFQLVDPAYLQQFAQQQFAQQPFGQPQFTQQPFSQPQLVQQQPQTVASADTGRQLTSLYDQSPRQRVVYQAAPQKPQSQPQAQAAYTPKLPANRRPIGASAQAQLAPSTVPQLQQQPQPQQQLLQSQQQLLQSQQQQLLQQDAPQQYLIETSQPGSPSVRYLDTLSQQDQQGAQGDAIYASLFSNAGRGLFSPAAPEQPSKSSIFASRTPAKAPPRTQEQLPVVRIPTPTNQRPLSRGELNALVNAGFSITPVGSEEPQASLLKAKRTPLSLTRRNHVIYQNQQDGVSYQYSPGSSDYNPTPKAKRYAPKPEPDVYRAHTASKGVVTYVMAIGNEAA